MTESSLNTLTQRLDYLEREGYCLRRATLFMHIALAIVSMLVLLYGAAEAAAYRVDLGIVTDFEDLRTLIDGCADLGVVESLRRQLDSVVDFEDLRPLLELKGIVEFTGCPVGISAPGVRRLRR